MIFQPQLGKKFRHWRLVFERSAVARRKPIKAATATHRARTGKVGIPTLESASTSAIAYSNQSLNKFYPNIELTQDNTTLTLAELPVLLAALWEPLQVQ